MATLPVAGPAGASDVLEPGEIVYVRELHERPLHFRGRTVRVFGTYVGVRTARTDARTHAYGRRGGEGLHARGTG